MLKSLHLEAETLQQQVKRTFLHMAWIDPMRRLVTDHTAIAGGNAEASFHCEANRQSPCWLIFSHLRGVQLHRGPRLLATACSPKIENADDHDAMLVEMLRRMQQNFPEAFASYDFKDGVIH